MLCRTVVEDGNERNLGDIIQWFLFKNGNRSFLKRKARKLASKSSRNGLENIVYGARTEV